MYRILITLLISSVSTITLGLPTSGELIGLIGKSASNPTLANLIEELEFTQHTSSFDRNANVYELNAFETGISLKFNQNFILQEIDLYDSGYLYKKFKGDVPMNLKLKMHFNYFQQQYGNFNQDTFNQFIYHASFVNGRASVYFKERHIELIRFVGTPSHIEIQDRNEMRNWGMRIIPDGDCTEGNCYSGSGQMKWSTSLQYTGDWYAGIPNGNGEMSDSAGFSYSGGYRLGFLWGDGSLRVPGQYSYKGRFIMGKKYGSGEMRYANGTRYSGTWLNDQMHGIGHYYYSSTYHYKGDFKNNQFNGKGKLTTPEGYIEGGFLNGKPHGKGKQVATKNHATLEGKWVNGKKEGVFQVYNPLVGSYEVLFENDLEMKRMRID